MNDGERLAAYLVGELDPEQQRALEARLARDPVLRARLETIRRTDAALTGLEDVAPDPAFSQRLRAELRRELGAAQPGDAEAGTRDRAGDELAGRRREREQRSSPRWLAPLGAAAAALVLFTAVGVGLSNLGGEDSAQETAGEAEFDTTATDAPAEAGMAPAGPVIVAQGRSYSADDVGSVTEHPAFGAVLGIGPEQAQRTSELYASSFGADESTAAAASDGDDAGGAADAAEEDAQAESQPAPPPQLRGEATDEELAAVTRCLPQLFEEAGTVVPVYAELAGFEGEAAIVYGLVAEEDPGSGEFIRAEVWVVGRDDCQVRYFTQRSG